MALAPEARGGHGERVDLALGAIAIGELGRIAPVEGVGLVVDHGRHPAGRAGDQQVDLPADHGRPEPEHERHLGPRGPGPERRQRRRVEPSANQPLDALGRFGVARGPRGAAAAPAGGRRAVPAAARSTRAPRARHCRSERERAARPGRGSSSSSSASAALGSALGRPGSRAPEHPLDVEAVAAALVQSQGRVGEVADRHRAGARVEERRGLGRHPERVELSGAGWRRASSAARCGLGSLTRIASAASGPPRPRRRRAVRGARSRRRRLPSRAAARAAAAGRSGCRWASARRPAEVRRFEDAAEQEPVAGARGGDVDQPAALLGLGLALRRVEVDQLPEPERRRGREHQPHAEPPLGAGLGRGPMTRSSCECPAFRLRPRSGTATIGNCRPFAACNGHHPDAVVALGLHRRHALALVAAGALGRQGGSRRGRGPRCARTRARAASACGRSPFAPRRRRGRSTRGRSRTPSWSARSATRGSGGALRAQRRQRLAEAPQCGVVVRPISSSHSWCSGGSGPSPKRQSSTGQT